MEQGLLDTMSKTAKDPRVRAAARLAGRPTKLTAARAERVIEYMLIGLTKESACAAVGISSHTLRNWEARASEWLEALENGEEIEARERLFVEFFRTLKMAEGQAELRLLRKVWEGGRGWQAYMTILERRWPKRWGRSEKRIHEGGDPEKPITFDVVPDSERREHVKRIMKETGAVKAES